MTTSGLENQVMIEPSYLQSIIDKIEPSTERKLLTWSHKLLGKNKKESLVYKIICTFLSNNETKDLLFVLKILKQDSLRNQMNHYYYWKRESLVYKSGLLNHSISL